MTALQIYVLFVLPALILAIGIGALIIFGRPSRTAKVSASAVPPAPIQEARPRVNPNLRLVG